MTMVVCVFAVAVNAFAAKLLSHFESVILVFHFVGFFAIIIPLWALAPTAPASEVFGNFGNYGGWSSVGAACLVGQLASAGAVRIPKGVSLGARLRHQLTPTPIAFSSSEPMERHTCLRKSKTLRLPCPG